MKKVFSIGFTGALIALGVFVFTAHLAIAAHPAGPAGYWALDEGAGTVATDSSGHSNDGAINGAVYAGSGAPVPGSADALSFDGVDDYVQVSDNAELDISTAITVAGWIRLDSFTQQATVAGKWRDISAANERGYLLVVATDGTPRFYISTTGADFAVATGAALSIGVWHHLLGTYDGTTVNLYVDGTLVASTLQVGAIFLNDEPLLIGANDGFGGSSRKFTDGTIDEVQIYNRVLTSDEIEILSNAGDTLFVDDDGQIGFGSIDCDGVGVGAYTVVQDAVDAASSGDTVQVCPGIYDEQVVIDAKNITLQGAGDTTIVKPTSASVLTSLYTTGTQAGAFFNGIVIASIIDVRNAGAAGVTVRDIKVDGELITSLPAGAGHVSGLTFGETGGLVDNVTVEDTNQVSPTTVRTYAMWFDAVGGTSVSVDVTDSTARLYGRNGINARGASITIDIDNNTIIGPGMVGPDQVPNGVLLIAEAGGTVTDNTISENHYTGATFLGSGVLLFQARDGIVVSGNEIFDTDDAVIINATDLASVENNDLHNNVKGVRIEAGSAGSNTVTKNLITDNTFVGIEVSDTAGAANVALRNAITGNATGVSNLNVSSFDATCNWWGDVSGPSGDGPGTGDSVSANAPFQPWLTTSDLVNGPCDGPLTTLTLVKTVVNDNGGTATTTDFALFIDGFPAASGVASTTSPGSHTASETPQGGYTPSAWGGDCAADGTITLALGENKTCTITNDDNEPSLTLQKIVVNDDGGTATTSDWTVTATGPTGFSGSGPIVPSGASFDAGSYDLSEAGPAGYTASDWVCVGGNQTDGDTIVIGLGENVLCTITNDDIAVAPLPPPANACAIPLVAPFGYTLINGSSGNDNLAIASFTMFVGNGGNDKVRAFGGNYIICTGSGKDIITLSGASIVTIDAGSGDNTIAAPVNIVGFITTGSGKDKIALGSGERTINAGDGNNIVTTTGSGDQTITTGSGNDKITTGSGNDTISAGSGKNVVVSGGGNDDVTGLGDKDIINGGPGIDTCDADGGTNIVVNCEL